MGALQQSECRPGERAVPIWPRSSLVMQQWPEFVAATLNLRCGHLCGFLVFCLFGVFQNLWFGALPEKGAPYQCVSHI